jgi:V8-like Glu-specific endopeptidase
VIGTINGANTAASTYRKDEPMQRVQDTNRSPYNAVGLIRMEWNDGETYYGSGALVAPNLVLTCAHNFVEKESEGNDHATSAAFYPGWNTHPLPTDGGTAAACVLVPEYYRRDDSWDIALMRLQNNIAVAHRFRPVASLNRSLEGREVRLTGYPQDDDDLDGFMFEDSDEITIVHLESNTVIMTHDTLPGSSGSPIWDADADHYNVYAVHNSYQTQGLRRGTLITRPVAEFLEGAQATPCGARFLHLLRRQVTYESIAGVPA